MSGLTRVLPCVTVLWAYLNVAVAGILFACGREEAVPDCGSEKLCEAVDALRHLDDIVAKDGG